jgi:hypothetical protein
MFLGEAGRTSAIRESEAFVMAAAAAMAGIRQCRASQSKRGAPGEQ